MEAQIAEGEPMKTIPRHNAKQRVTAGDPRGVFYDLFPAEEAAELAMRAELLRGLQHWLEEGDLTQVKIAAILGVTQARVSDLKRGKINKFSLDLLVRLAHRAGLQPQLRLAA